jgi:hypothetical protein
MDLEVSRSLHRAAVRAFWRTQARVTLRLPRNVNCAMGRLVVSHIKSSQMEELIVLNVVGI